MEGKVRGFFLLSTEDKDMRFWPRPRTVLGSDPISSHCTSAWDDLQEEEKRRRRRKGTASLAARQGM